MASLRDWGRDCTCRSGEDDRCGRRFARQCGELPFGYDHKYVFSEFGYNLKVTEMQAAVGCAQLQKLPEFTRRRRENHATLASLLAPVVGLLSVQEATPGSEPSWFGLLLTLTPEAKASGLTRDAMVRQLEAAKIQTRMLFAGNIVRQPCFDGMRAAAGAGSLGAGYRVAGALASTDRIMRRFVLAWRVPRTEGRDARLHGGADDGCLWRGQMRSRADLWAGSRREVAYNILEWASVLAVRDTRRNPRMTQGT